MRPHCPAESDRQLRAEFRRHSRRDSFGDLRADLDGLLRVEFRGLSSSTVPRTDLA
jgi:hypothetical protein